MKITTRILSLCAATVVLAGCANLMTAEVGKRFSLDQIQQWSIGKTTLNEFIAFHGENPINSKKKETDEGTIDLLIYQYAKNLGKNMLMRLVIAEFKNGILNGLVVESNMPGDYQPIDFSLREKIVNAVSNKEDVRALFGDPMGRANFPTELEHPEVIDVDKKRMNEIWYYAEIKAEIIGWGQAKTYSSLLSIGFDENGFVVGKQFESDIN